MVSSVDLLPWLPLVACAQGPYTKGESTLYASVPPHEILDWQFPSRSAAGLSRATRRASQPLAAQAGLSRCPGRKAVRRRDAPAITLSVSADAQRHRQHDAFDPVDARAARSQRVGRSPAGWSIAFQGPCRCHLGGSGPVPAR